MMSNLLGALDPGGTLMKYYTVSTGVGCGGARRSFGVSRRSFRLRSCGTGGVDRRVCRCVAGSLLSNLKG